MTSAVSILLARRRARNREAPRPIRSVGEKLSENEPPGLFGYVELEFIERLARRFAADKAHRSSARSGAPTCDTPPVTARTTNRASGSSAANSSPM